MVLPVSSVASKLAPSSPSYHPWLQLPWGNFDSLPVKFEGSTHQPTFHNLSHKDSIKDFLRCLSVLKTCLVWAISFFNSGHQPYYNSVDGLDILSDFLSFLKYLIKKTLNICRRVERRVYSTPVIYSHFVICLANVVFFVEVFYSRYHTSWHFMP